MHFDLTWAELDTYSGIIAYTEWAAFAETVPTNHSSFLIIIQLKRIDIWQAMTLLIIAISQLYTSSSYTLWLLPHDLVHDLGVYPGPLLVLLRLLQPPFLFFYRERAQVAQHPIVPAPSHVLRACKSGVPSSGSGLLTLLRRESEATRDHLKKMGSVEKMILWVRRWLIGKAKENLKGKLILDSCRWEREEMGPIHT